MRFDGHRYCDCRWCRGRGCVYCESEAKKAYGAEFPNGPQPIATFDMTTPEGVEAAGKFLKSLIKPKSDETGGAT